MDEIADLEPVLLDQVGTYLHKQEEQNFEDAGQTFDAPWEALRPGTVREKARLGLPQQDLVRTGRLAGALGESVSLTPGSVSVGIDPGAVPYAAAQNARRLLVSLTPQMVDDIQKRLEEWAQSLGIPPGAVQFTPA